LKIRKVGTMTARAGIVAMANLRRILAKKKIDYEVLKVVDATTPLTLTIPNSINKIAKRNNPMACGIACEVKKDPNVDHAVVSRRMLYILKDGIATRRAVSLNGTVSLLAFDRGGSFLPGVYTFLPPSKSHRLGFVRKHYPNGKKGKNGPRVREHVAGREFLF